MARLSAEHFRAQEQTPKQNTNPFARLLRQSRSPSTPMLHGDEDKSASPLGSSSAKKLKKGWKMIGVHPAERQSLGSVEDADEGRPATAGASLARQQEELKNVSVPHNVDTSLEAAATTNAEELVGDWEKGKKVRDEAENKTQEIKKGDPEDKSVAYNGDGATEKEVCSPVYSLSDVLRLEQEKTASQVTIKSAEGCIASADSVVYAEKSNEQAIKTGDSINLDLPFLPEEQLLQVEEPASSSVCDTESDISSIHAKSLKLGSYCITNAKILDQIQRHLPTAVLVPLVVAALWSPLFLLRMLWTAGVLLTTYELISRKLGWQDKESPDAVYMVVQDGWMEFFQIAASFLGWLGGVVMVGLMEGYESVAGEHK